LGGCSASHTNARQDCAGIRCRDGQVIGMMDTILGIVAGALIWAAAWVDVRSRRIPNALSLTGAALGLLVHTASGGFAGCQQSLFGLALGLALMLPGYLLRSTGAGDVKLMAAAGALLGPERIFVAFIATILVGAAIGLGYASFAWRARGAVGPWTRYRSMVQFFWVTGIPSYVPPGPEEFMGQRFPFAVPIAIGATLAVFWPL
jgi:prepilin peptidase CpaA